MRTLVVVTAAAVLFSSQSAFAQDGTFGNVKSGTLGQRQGSQRAERLGLDSLGGIGSSLGIGGGSGGSSGIGGTISGALGNAGLGGSLGNLAGGALGDALGGALPTDIAGFSTNDVFGAVGESGILCFTGDCGESSGGSGTKIEQTGDISQSVVAGESTGTARYEAIVGTPDFNNLMLAHDGWDTALNGYERTPILFDSISTNRQRQYPKLDQADGSLQRVSVSADDEVIKSSLAIYRPLSGIKASFAQNQADRDRHLDLFKTMQGIATLTLSYLDKTVGAGLAATEQRADMDSIQQLLKQINWTTAKIADPSRSQLFQDTEEKFNLCMALNGGTSSLLDENGFFDPKKKTATGQDSGLGTANVLFNPSYARVNLKCSICDLQYKPVERGTDTVQASAYHYCVCCAEQGTIVNRAAVIMDGEKNVSNDGLWSLAERAFGGKYLEYSKEKYDGALSTGGIFSAVGDAISAGEDVLDSLSSALDGSDDLVGSANEIIDGVSTLTGGGKKSKMELSDLDKAKGYLVKQYIETFRGLYGDVVIDTRANNGIFSFRYASPTRSVSAYIDQLRNGPPDGCEGMMSCPINNEKVKWGICPAMKRLVYGSKIALKDYDGYDFPFAELSGGTGGSVDTSSLLNKIPGAESMSSGQLLAAAQQFYQGASDADKNEIRNQITALTGSVGLGSLAGSLGNVLSQNPVAETYRLWVEASLGAMLTAQDVDALKSRAVSDPALSRWIENFCDASSVAAFKRLHLRMKVLALDHLALNQAMTEQQKAMIIRLFDRVSENLAAAEVDVNAGMRAESMLAGIRAEYASKKTASSINASNSFIGMMANNSRRDDTPIFGAFPGFQGPQ